MSGEVNILMSDRVREILRAQDLSPLDPQGKGLQSVRLQNITEPERIGSFSCPGTAGAVIVNRSPLEELLAV
jgi:hypothetical protein